MHIIIYSINLFFIVFHVHNLMSIKFRSVVIVKDKIRYSYTTYINIYVYYFRIDK